MQRIHIFDYLVAEKLICPILQVFLGSIDDLFEQVLKLAHLIQICLLFRLFGRQLLFFFFLFLVCVWGDIQLFFFLRFFRRVRMLTSVVFVTTLRISTHLVINVFILVALSPADKEPLFNLKIENIKTPPSTIGNQSLRIVGRMLIDKFWWAFIDGAHVEALWNLWHPCLKLEVKFVVEGYSLVLCRLQRCRFLYVLEVLDENEGLVREVTMDSAKHEKPSLIFRFAVKLYYALLAARLIFTIEPHHLPLGTFLQLLYILVIGQKAAGVEPLNLKAGILPKLVSGTSETVDPLLIDLQARMRENVVVHVWNSRPLLLRKIKSLALEKDLPSVEARATVDEVADLDNSVRLSLMFHVLLSGYFSGRRIQNEGLAAVFVGPHMRWNIHKMFSIVLPWSTSDEIAAII